ncbi:predicted protein [Naegleria gruberi]|uniref:Predicted protein n=1 Tax=Naegleria gruberi TaxID=5762 RepID=D2VXD8_NAEGR|nr:uncharacterized protein NAEGRDRAFT_53004 [Naegleria gruberi]EFC38490.1 predicted protein [Naegleria gruberi]|eukprot:XP_002671234.1 predicted protein [Naegleria gruberi strain NEG-M]
MLKNKAESNVFLTFSGVHGQEGFVGSPIQIAMIKNDTKYQFNLPDNTYPVHIHMLNPYGASYATKENENNVDMLKNLNEHYIDAPGWEISKNVLLEQFIDGMNISHLHLDTVQAQAVNYFYTLLAKVGLPAFTQSSVIGQIHRQIGIAYAGTTEEWTAKQVKIILNQLLKGYSSEYTKSRKVLYIDLHSAVGEYGNVYAMFDPEWIPFAKQYLLKNEYIHDNLFPFPSGKYFGHFIKDHALMSGSEANLTIVPTAWEIGTFPQDAYQNYFLMQLNCRFYQNLPDRSAQFCPFVNSKVGEYFYPQDDSWKTWAFGNLTVAMRSSMNGMNQWVLDEKWRIASLANCNIMQSLMVIVMIICLIVLL